MNANLDHFYINLQLEPDGVCWNDVVEINEGPFEYLAAKCDVYLPDPVTTTKPYAQVIFESNFNIRFPGFVLEYYTGPFNGGLINQIIFAT